MPPPARRGIPASRVHLPPGPWETLFHFLCERFPRLPPDVLRQRLEAGEILDDDGVPQPPDARYRPGAWLWYYREVPDEAPVPYALPVLHRDERLLVVDKPHFMASTPGGRHLRHTALLRLRRDLDLPALSPLHRLDRDTAGVLMFCVDPALRGRYQALFQDRAVAKEYEAVAVAPPDLRFPILHRSRIEEIPGRLLMHETPGQANSETRIECLRRLDATGRLHLRLLPLTGRKHQLRVHMRALGMPIENDAWYAADLQAAPDAGDGSWSMGGGSGSGPWPADDPTRPLQLLARAVEFRDPLDGRLRRYESRRVLQGVAEASASRG